MPVLSPLCYEAIIEMTIGSFLNTPARAPLGKLIQRSTSSKKTRSDWLPNESLSVKKGKPEKLEGCHGPWAPFRWGWTEWRTVTRKDRRFHNRNVASIWYKPASPSIGEWGMFCEHGRAWTHPSSGPTVESKLHCTVTPNKSGSKVDLRVGVECIEERARSLWRLKHRRDLEIKVQFSQVQTEPSKTPTATDETGCMRASDRKCGRQ